MRLALSTSLILVTALTSEMRAQSEQAAPAPLESPAATLDLQGSLAAARQLYASADYRKALDTLERLTTANPSPRDRQSIDLYRTFCFVALGKTEEADEAITAMIARDPLFRPADSEIPPRLRAMFSDKRKSVLPAIIQSRYARAKAAFDQHDYKTAASGFTELLAALSDPDIAGPASRSPLSDLRVLAAGFNDLAAQAMTPPPQPRSDTPAPPPRDASIANTARMPRIYDSNDADVVAPVTVRQDIPRFSMTVLSEKTGVLFIVIGETGSVESAIITQPLDTAYDRMLLAAAKAWSYQPATRNGIAVKYRKRIQVTLPRQTN
ncbi:MAG TPA: energy transducer TonB [Vicinamibacterales bacterium]|nr:energy transducer TonB [Vicinamibacterales bacterium]